MALSFSIVLFLSCSAMMWVALFLMIIGERTAWHGDSNYKHSSADVGKQFSGHRALFERETDEGHIVDYIISETLSLNPRVKLFHDFLTDEECDLLIAEGNNNLEESKVVGAKGENTLNTARSSSGTFLMKRSEIVRRIETRIARVTMLPQENQEAFYLLRYLKGQEYKIHPDYFATDTPEARDVLLSSGGQRVATFLIYLSDVEEGGSTLFSKVGVTVLARKGQAVFWYDAHLNGSVDEISWHAGMPVVKGTKYCITKWIRQQKFGSRVV